MAVLGDGDAVVALAAGLRRRTALAVGTDAVQGAGDDPRRRRLADAAHAREREGMGQAPAPGSGQVRTIASCR
jgi:hypothetical protein